MNLRILFLFLLANLNAGLWAQSPCQQGRYQQEIFTAVDVDFNVTYGENVQPTIFNPNATQVLRMDVYEPQGDTLAERPLIVWAFGGGFVVGTKLSPDIVDLSNRLGRLGYVCVSIDYRLSPELALTGSERLAMLATIKGVHDMRAALRWFYKDAANGNQYRIDTSKIFVGGVSAGAIAAVHTGYVNELSELPPSILGDTAGLGGLEGNSGNPGYSSEVAGVINLSGAIGDTAWMDANEVPIVSIHGTNDPTVPYGSSNVTLFGINMGVFGSSIIHQRADDLGIDNYFESFEGAGHTPFILGSNPGPYMDSTFWVVRDFLFDLVCPNSVGIDPVAAKQLTQVWPQPAEQRVHFRLGEDRIQSIQLRDLHGRILPAANEIKGAEASLDIRSLASGIYFLEVKGHSGQYYRGKVWKE